MCYLLAALQISKGDLEVVRQAKARLDGQLARVAGVKEELEDLLDDDQDMRNMYLGRQVLGTHFSAAWSARSACQQLCGGTCLHPGSELPLSEEALGRQSAAKVCGLMHQEQRQVGNVAPGDLGGRPPLGAWTLLAPEGGKAPWDTAMTARS